MKIKKCQYYLIKKSAPTVSAVGGKMKANSFFPIRLPL